MSTQAPSTEPLAVYLEVGQKRVFACALDWPGWCRSGKTEALALEGLAAYATRYAAVAREAGLPFQGSPAPTFTVVERLPGTGTTDFGAWRWSRCQSSEYLPPTRARSGPVRLEPHWNGRSYMLSAASE